MKRLTKRQMIIFAIGQLGWSILGGIINTWLVTYYMPTSDDMAAGAVNMIKPGYIIIGLTILGIITAISRLFDAVTDPLIASLSDRSKNKRGRRIPFMQYSAIPFAVITVLLFITPVHGVSTINVVWVSVFIILFYLFMTMYCTPYNALISEFGKTQEDRMFISTAISFTYFAGTLLAYTPFLFGGMLREVVHSYDWGYRICFIVLAAIALAAMLLPTFLLNEKEFVNSEPSKSNMFKSLTATFKNRDFRTFVGSDLMYWIGLTLFQTGLPFFVNVSMGLDKGFTTYFMGGMTVLSACFYPMVSGLVRKYGKKKLTILGFLGLAAAYLSVGLANVITAVPGWIFGVVTCLIAAFPMALLGIIPQSIVADVAEAEGVTTGENREGMFFAARTFAMKLGQSIAMLAFTSLAIIGASQTVENEITASPVGLAIVAAAAIVFCVLGAVILMLYDEKKVMNTISHKSEQQIETEKAE